jgi:hypothetical protein
VLEKWTTPLDLSANLHVTRTGLLYDTYELLCKWIIALAEKVVGFFGYSRMEQQRFVLE